ncbi:M48 family metalloprotease [Methylophilus aquaticus]|uniref:M48 family metalloprotease n=1 Tax=Methylophilus aquaticus TaxID=1971610 RepID=A0ABT9JT63_9PROT|nr:M48 family metalloprotease [Methylophilus aquaticus]MDP8567711.1 M48 family metalloprotease [Methylophilus aquaticus]
MNHNVLKQKAIALACAACLIGTSQAFDLKGALKDAVKEQIGVTDKKETSTAPASGTADNASAQDKLANINWTSPSLEDEIAVGRNVTGTILGAAPLVSDAGLQAYVNKVGRWVASQSERADIAWHFGVIDSSDINAFATPGGYVLITKGLYQRLTSEAQLAGVLGHEIAHVVQKHHLKVMQKQALLDAGTAFLKEKISKNKLTQRAVSTGAEISARNLDKSAEYEADSMGTVLAARAGYEVYGLAEVLQALAQVSNNDSSMALLFQTHPHPDERLAQLSLISGNQLDSMEGGKTLDSRLYRLK